MKINHFFKTTLRLSLVLGLLSALLATVLIGSNYLAGRESLVEVAPSTGINESGAAALTQMLIAIIIVLAINYYREHKFGRRRRSILSRLFAFAKKQVKAKLSSAKPQPKPAVPSETAALSSEAIAQLKISKQQDHVAVRGRGGVLFKV